MSTLLEKQLNRDFAKWKQCGNTIVGLRVADQVHRTVDIYALEITQYNKEHQPIKTTKQPRTFKGVKVETWTDVENLVFGTPNAPDFSKVLS